MNPSIRFEDSVPTNMSLEFQAILMYSFQMNGTGNSKMNILSEIKIFVFGLFFGVRYLANGYFPV